MFSVERAIYQQWLISSNTGLPQAALIHPVPITELCQKNSQHLQHWSLAAITVQEHSGDLYCTMAIYFSYTSVIYRHIYLYIWICILNKMHEMLCQSRLIGVDFTTWVIHCLFQHQCMCCEARVIAQNLFYKLVDNKN